MSGSERQSRTTAGAAVADPFDLNLRHLDAIVVIAQTGRIRAAAAAIGMTQPALTQAVAALERQLTIRLFDRRAYGIVPTAAGAAFILRGDQALRCLAIGCGIEASDRRALLARPGHRLSMRQLRVFAAAAGAGDVAAAARLLAVEPATVMQTVRQLEAVLGVELACRSGQALTLTEAGERFARGAGLAAAELRAGLEELATLGDGGAARLMIGTLPLPGMVLLPEALSRFAAARDALDVEVLKTDHADLSRRLRTGGIDVLLGELRPAAPLDLEQEPLFEEELYVVASSQHPLAGTLADHAALARFPWVVASPGSPTRAAWERLFAGGGRPLKLIQCGSPSTIRGLLLAGEWLALLSPGQFRLEKEVGALRAIGGAVPGTRRRIGLTVRRHWQPTRAQHAFLATLRAVAGEIAAAGG